MEIPSHKVSQKFAMNNISITKPGVAMDRELEEEIFFFF